MSELKATKGPWQREGAKILINYDVMLCASAFCGTVENAQLMNASHDLYKSTKMALDAIYMLAEEYGSIPDYLDDITSSLESALSKARGE